MPWGFHLTTSWKHSIKSSGVIFYSPNDWMCFSFHSLTTFSSLGHYPHLKLISLLVFFCDILFLVIISFFPCFFFFLFLKRNQQEHRMPKKLCQVGSSLVYYYCCCCYFGHTVQQVGHGSLVPWLGIEPRPLAMEMQSLNYWNTM